MARSAMPLYRRALKQPQHVRRVLEIVRDQGLRAAISRVKGQLEAGTPTGYSAAGTIIAVGERVEGFAIGDRVACAGTGIANHAEVIAVPVNLAARIPDGLDTAEACTVTLGAIALQGIRRAAPTLGEAQSIRAGGKPWRADGNFSATLGFADGSVCTLLYTALGAKDHSKERLEVFADGMVLDLDDYRSLLVAGRKAKGWDGNQDKGHKALMAALAEGLKTGVWPTPLEQQIAATRTALQIQALIQAGSP